jgi:hypothetical protein
MRTPEQIKEAVEAFLEFHAVVIATDPEAAFYARNLKYALAEGFLEGPDAEEILRQGELCRTHLLIQAIARDTFPTQ